jgi:hypothetical protein
MDRQWNTKWRGYEKNEEESTPLERGLNGMEV